jgi:hypothetical protein
MGTLGLRPDQLRDYEAYIEGRVLELATKAGRKELERQWQGLRRGWYVGDRSFAHTLQGRLARALQGRLRESLSGGAKESHDAAAAERALALAIQRLGMAPEALPRLPRAAAEKVVLAWWLRQHTTVPLKWVSHRLAMGHYSRVTQAVSRMRRRPGAKLEKFRRKLCHPLSANPGEQVNNPKLSSFQHWPSPANRLVG